MRAPYVSINVHAGDGGRRAGAAEIVEAIRAELDAGRLHAGARLPPVRVLEHQLGISKNTVQAAYDELCARGLLLRRPRDGVLIAAPPESAAPPPRLALPARGKWKDLGAIPGWPRPGVLSLSSVFIDPALLPREKLADCFRSVLHEPLRPFYDPQGHLPLREAIARRLSARGMDVTPGEVIVTLGSQQAIDLVARAQVRPSVALEDPVYANARLLFAHLGYDACALPLDPFAAPDLDAWERKLRAHRPALLYAITSYQNPTGYSYSSHELTRLLELSSQLGFAILEDDWGSDMLSGSEYRPTLRALGGKNVLYVNSFTKKLLPSLRLGFVVAPPEAVAALVTTKRVSTLANPTLLEATLAEFLERGYYDSHLRAVQAALDARYHACLALLRERLPGDVRFTTPGGGPTLWLELPRSIDLRALRQRLDAVDVHVEDTTNHFAGTPHLHGFRLSYAFLSEAQMELAVTRLAEVLKAMR